MFLDLAAQAPGCERRRRGSKPPAVLCEGSISQPAVPAKTQDRMWFVIYNENYRGFPGSSGIRTLRSHCPEPEFNLWSGN